MIEYIKHFNIINLIDLLEEMKYNNINNIYLNPTEYYLLDICFQKNKLTIINIILIYFIHDYSTIIYLTELALLYKNYNIMVLILQTYNTINIGSILEKCAEYKFNKLAQFILLNYNIDQEHINNTMIISYYTNNFELFQCTVSNKNYNINNDYILKHSSINKNFKFLFHLLNFYKINLTSDIQSDLEIVKYLYYYKFVCFLWKIKKFFTY